ncbi:serpin-Z10 [Artemisia annua]|uniref:Serpin-Z10 n=1 Tax=Artemisia annua TaxID=35608 RepID=A0A2U1NWG8_ARTAN|nr:serpin-Z10 [Artemisia annua]
MAQERCPSMSANTTSVITKTLLDDAQRGFTNGNFVCSPLSLDIVLGMLTVGAVGYTLKQLLGFLRYGSIDQFFSQSPSAKLLAQSLSNRKIDGLEFVLANGVWVQKFVNLESSYKRILEDFYKTQVKHVDFKDKVKLNEVVGEINSWIEKETKGLIPSVVNTSDFTENDFLVLANVLYFKGDWHKQFAAQLTTTYAFGLINGDTVNSVPYMTLREPSFDYGSFQGFKMIKLPYKINDQSNRFSMYIFLPDRQDGLQDLLKLFHSNDTLFHGDFDLKWTKFRHLWIPKFKISTTFDPEDVMKQMGLTLPFLKTNTEFSGIVKNEMIYVSKILQKSIIEVDEKGTVAASFSMVKGAFGGCASAPEIDFVADHPFMFMIREDTSKGVLFVGVVLNPSLN